MTLAMKISFITALLIAETNFQSVLCQQQVLLVSRNVRVLYRKGRS